MLYRNRTTGAVVEFSTKIIGGPWEPIEVPRSADGPEPKTAAKAPKKTGTKKK